MADVAGSDRNALCSIGVQRRICVTHGAGASAFPRSAHFANGMSVTASIGGFFSHTAVDWRAGFTITLVSLATATGAIACAVGLTLRIL